MIFLREEMMQYNFNEIEKKWQDYWDTHNTFRTNVTDKTKPKYYIF